MYTGGMDVPVSALRAHLGDWIDRAKAGEEILVTDRGTPVARLSGLSTTPTLERLVAAGVIGRAATNKRPSAVRHARVPVEGSVADLVGDQRR